MRKEACIFDIQRFSVHDGPGIRTNVFLKGCPLDCRWCCNPESQKAYPEQLFNGALCIGCNRCVTACTYGAVTIEQGAMRFHRDLCIDCGDCIETCYAEARTMKGRTYSVDEIVDEILKDTVFYENSGGGVTFSGGEPMLHVDFLEEVMAQCKARGIHIAVETCGYAPKENFLRLVKYVDLFLFDIKHFNSHIHKEFTGVGNEKILENCKAIRAVGAQVITRVPVIPTFNMNVETLSNIASFAVSIGIKEMNLLPYHRFAANKYDMLGRDYWHPGVERVEIEEVEVLRDAIAREGIKIAVGG